MVNRVQPPERVELKREVVGSRVTRPERRLVEAAASSVGRSVSSFVRVAAVVAARECLAMPGPARVREAELLAIAQVQANPSVDGVAK